MLGEDDAAFFAAQYDVTAEGNFEGHNILNRLKHLPRSMEDEEQARADARRSCSRRAPSACGPGLDDKVLADWNGLMIAGLANAGAMLGEPAWIEHGRARPSRSSPPRWRAATGSAIPGARAGCCFPGSRPISPP